jgi:formate-dependent nitrite reductase cytochrome c552 subunit
MKTKLITKACCMAAALAFTAAFASNAFAAETKTARGGASDLMSLKPITTRAEADALKPGDAIAMACTKCKSIMVHNVTKERGQGAAKVMTVGEKHLCPGCNTYIETVGRGKGAKDEIRHVCEKCGDDSVFCCATNLERVGRKAWRKTRSKRHHGRIP